MRQPILAACVALLLVGCSGDADDEALPGERSTTTAEVLDVIPLSDAPAALVSECQAAATHLGFAVPCPTRVPRVGGAPASCEGGCVSRGGAEETLHELFSFDVADFVGGEALGPVRHVRLEARRLQDVPPVACYDGVPADAEAPDVRPGATVLHCPDATAESQANTRHGEGAHAGHLLAYWDQDGVRYVVSVHGTSSAAERLLSQLAQNIDVVDP